MRYLNNSYKSIFALLVLLAMSLVMLQSNAYAISYENQRQPISQTQTIFQSDYLTKSKPLTMALSPARGLSVSSSEQQKAYTTFIVCETQHLLVASRQSNSDSVERTHEALSLYRSLTTSISQNSLTTEIRDSENFSKKHISKTARLFSDARQKKSWMISEKLLATNLKTSTTAQSKQSFKLQPNESATGRISVQSIKHESSLCESLRFLIPERPKFVAHLTGNLSASVWLKKRLKDSINLNPVSLQRSYTRAQLAKRFQKTRLDL